MSSKPKKEPQHYDGPENPTLAYFPQMLQTSVILIVDHNITRFHMYDLFKRILLEKDEFIRILKKRPEVEDFIMLKGDTLGKLRWAYTMFTPDFVSDVFGTREHYIDLLRKYLPDERMQCTPTALTNGIENIFGNRHICGAILRQIGDKRPNEEDGSFSSAPNFKTFLTNNIIDAKSLIEFVNKNGFNAVMVDSVQLAATMSYETTGVTYLISTYRFNFDNEGTLMGKEHLTLAELNNKNEYGIFNPFNFTVPSKHDEKEEEKDGNSP